MAHRGLRVLILSILNTGLNSLTLMLGRACPPGRRPGPANSEARASHVVTSTGTRTGAWSTAGPVSILASSTRSGLGLQQRPTQLGVSGLVCDKYAGFEGQLIRDKGHLTPSGTVGNQPALSLPLSPDRKSTRLNSSH